MTAPRPVDVTVEVSHDGSTWTDVFGKVVGVISFQRGRSAALGEWQPGTASFTLNNDARTYDPTNDSATFQIRPGDHLKITVDAVAAWRGWIDSAVVSYAKGPTMFSTINVAGTDGLAKLARATVLAPGAGTGTGFTAPFYSGTNVDTVLALSQLDYTDSATTDAGDVVSVLPFDGEFNGLELLQGLTRTEGGNSQLFTLKDGTLRWRSRYAKASQLVALGGTGGIAYAEVQVDYSDELWANVVNVTPAAHTTLETSATSVTSGTGSKSFTLDSPIGGDAVGFAAGDAVYIESRGSTGNNMTGTVTSYNESTRALVVNIDTKNGTSTRTDWDLEFTMAATRQSATDSQSRTRYGQYRTADVSTYHRNLTAALAEATIRAATSAHPRRYVSRCDVELNSANLSAGNIDTVLGLEIGDAVGVSVVLGTGSPSTVYQARMIDGIAHRINVGGSHVVAFTLGPEVTLDFTAVVKQNGSTVASTTNEAVYTTRDDRVWAHGHLSITAAGTNNTELKVTPTGLPAPYSANAGDCVGSWSYTDTGTGRYSGGDVVWDGTDIHFYAHSTSTVTPLGQNPTFAAANGDTLRFELDYRRA